jgi:hypothetical protein
MTSLTKILVSLLLMNETFYTILFILLFLVMTIGITKVIEYLIADYEENNGRIRRKK